MLTNRAKWADLTFFKLVNCAFSLTNGGFVLLPPEMQPGKGVVHFQMQTRKAKKAAAWLPLSLSVEAVVAALEAIPQGWRERPWIPEKPTSDSKYEFWSTKREERQARSAVSPPLSWRFDFDLSFGLTAFFLDETTPDAPPRSRSLIPCRVEWKFFDHSFSNFSIFFLNNMSYSYGALGAKRKVQKESIQVREAKRLISRARMKI